ncbi:MAG TPA: amidohydrolase [Burkholderiales bacterium]|jgi:predicted amidohydrolase YtcJ|nr:amidohydrolase [Burkholderiales bacterium]
MFNIRIGVATIASFLAACAGGGPTAPEGEAADLILHNGRIVTVDGGFTIARAVAVRGDRFVAVGDDARIRLLASAKTRQIDLRGRTVIPGLMDGHLHNAGGGPGVDLSSSRSVNELLAAVEARARASAAGAIIVSNGDWHEAQLKEKRLPHRRELDRVAPRNPVVLVRGGHEFILNSAALERWGISRATASPAGGEIGHDADGELNGELVDTARGLVKLPPPPKLTPEGIAAQMRLLNSVGLTSVRIPGSFQFGGDILAPYRMFQELKAKGELTMRVNYLMRIFDFSSVEKVRATIASWNVRPDEGDEWLRIGGMKTLIDGGFEGGHMREPYAEPYGRGGKFKGIQVVPIADYNAVVMELNRQGWRVATHAVGDAAVDQVLAAYEAADRERSIRDRRWTIEHLFIGRPDHYPRIRALGVVVSAQDHLYLAAPSLANYWGRARAEQVTPVRTFLDEKLLVAGGTDSPVIPYNPFWAMYHFVTRNTISDGVYGASQRITREEALRIYTINNARLTFEEGIKGSIEPGKLADLVVLSADFLTVAEGAIPSIKPLATMVGGKFVHVAAPDELGVGR